MSASILDDGGFAARSDPVSGDANGLRLPLEPITVGRSPTIRLQLRHRTAAVHEALHNHPVFVRLLGKQITISEYRTLLARLYGFHWPLERGLRTASAEVLCGLDVLARERSPALRADLEVLGMLASDIDALPFYPGLPLVRSNAALMGRLYVVEGSALGGQILAAKLDGLLGVHGQEGRRFLLGRTQPDPLPWPAFCRLLETQVAPSETCAVLESAETTFRALAHWLAQGERDV